MSFEMHPRKVILPMIVGSVLGLMSRIIDSSFVMDVMPSDFDFLVRSVASLQ
jgi:hypothetical protein